MTKERPILESCEHLQLIPLETDRERIRDYVRKLRRKEDVSELTEELFRFLWGGRREILGKPYLPHCKKNNQLCVIMDSPVMAMQQYGDMYQPLGISMINTPRIRNCIDRELPETNYDGLEMFPEFLLRRIVGQLNIEEGVKS